MGQLSNNYCVLTALVACLCLQAFAQQSGTPQQSQDTDVVRISVRLVQVDGTVTDKQGHQVTDLTKDDFELFVDGQRQKVTNFAYIPAQPVVKASSTRQQKKDRGEPLAVPPPVRLRPDQVRRTMALVVANVSYESLIGVKKALSRFVDAQMQPGDLVSIIRISDVAGVVQQFTSDKRLLHLAIEGVRWNPLGGVGVRAVPDEQPERVVDPNNDSANAKARAESFYNDVVGSSWLRKRERAWTRASNRSSAPSSPSTGLAEATARKVLRPRIQTGRVRSMLRGKATRMPRRRARLPAL